MRQFFGRLLPLALGVLASAAFAMPLAAHEFWLDPVSFAPRVGAKVPIVLRNGQNFLGDSYPYQRKWAQRFAIIDAKGERTVKAVEGDDPAAEVASIVDGLAIVAFQRAPDVVVYPAVAQFLETLDDEGLDEIAARYRATTAAPSTKVRESYARFAKTLLSVGAGGGADKPIGFAFEIVVEGNPYALAAGAPIVMRVLQGGKPVAGVQVKAFNRSDPQSPRRVRTDADGRAAIPDVPAGEVLLSAAVMTPGDLKAKEANVRADWNSLWASVTFKKP